MKTMWKRLSFPAIALAVTMLACSAMPAKAMDFTGIYLAPKFVYGIQVMDSNRQTGTLPHSWKSSESDVFGGGIALGYSLETMLNCPIRAELEYLAFGNKKMTKSANVLGNYTTYSQRVGVQSLFLNFLWDIRTGTRWTPYIGAGVGAGFLSMKSSNTVDGGVYNGSLSTNYGDHTRFAWNVGAGVSFTVNERLAFDLGYRYADYGQAKSGTVVAANGYALRGKSDITMHQFILGARISF